MINIGFYFLLGLMVAVELSHGQSHVMIYPGTFYHQRLNKHSFFNTEDALDSDPVRFMVSVSGLPDPPSWLTFVQPQLSHDALLYGTPHTGNDSVVLDIVAVNKRTQQTAYMTIELQVSGDKDLSHQLEFAVTNYEVTDLLDFRQLDRLVDSVRYIWSSGDEPLLRVISVEPLHDSHGQHNPGVLVRVGSDTDVSAELRSLLTWQPCVDGSSLQLPAQYHFDWCSFVVIDQHDSLVTDAPLLQPVNLQDSAWSPSDIDDVPRRDFRLLFILSVILPLLLGAILLAILSVVMFGRREGVEKRNKESTPTQMMHFNTIRQATAKLRLMSSQRDCGTGVSPTASRTGTRANTPKRDLAVMSTSTTGSTKASTG